MAPALGRPSTVALGQEDSNRLAPNPFAVGDPTALDDEELLDRVGIYRALLRRLGAYEGSVLRVREQLDETLRELEAEVGRRGRSV